MPTPQERFLAECKPRYGTSNPERMHVAHWESMIRVVRDPWAIRQELGLESNYPKAGADRDPDWSFDRFGMSRTPMADGRIICVGGEHEDSYDPDFCIYNDVIVLRPEAGDSWVSEDRGRIEIYCYPREVFPPTDFHSATLVGREIILIGRMGYGDERFGRTPVYSLDTETYEIKELVCRGEEPGWISRHHAWYHTAMHAITLRGGNIERPGRGRLEEFDGVYQLDLASLTWKAISKSDDRLYYVIQARGSQNRQEPQAEDFTALSIPHTVLPQDQGRAVPTYCLDVSGVRVTFVEFYDEVQVTIEGSLAQEACDALLGEVLANLNRRRGRWTMRQVNRFDR